MTKISNSLGHWGRQISLFNVDGPQSIHKIQHRIINWEKKMSLMSWAKTLVFFPELHHCSFFSSHLFSLKLGTQHWLFWSSNLNKADFGILGLHHNIFFWSIQKCCKAIWKSLLSTFSSFSLFNCTRFCHWHQQWKIINAYCVWSKLLSAEFWDNNRNQTIFIYWEKNRYTYMWQFI